MGTNKTAFFILSLLVTIQGCQIYQPVPVSLEEAAKSSLKTKIVTQNGDNLHYKKIIAEKQQFFGLKKKNGNLVKFPLDEEEIASILVKDKKKSSWANFLLIVGIPLGISFILLIIILLTWGY